MARVQLEAESSQIRRARNDLRDLNRTGLETDRTVRLIRRSLIALGSVAAFRGLIRTTGEFTQSIADLAAITGAAGDELDFYRERAAEIGRTTSLSASQAADAFRLIASAQPDLLDSADALSAVTEEAVTLAEATGMSLPDAATALGGALNQFQLQAEQSSEVINIMAASAQRGTVEVQSITESLVNAGATANALNIDLAETVAGLQALARANITGSRAGTSLNQVLLGLERTNDQALMPSVVGLVDALDGLAERQMTNNEIIAEFGREALPAVQAMLAQRNAARELNTTIRDTNTAYEQAETRMDTFTGGVQQLQAALEGLTIAVFGDDVEGLNRALVQAATEGVSTLTENIDTLASAGTALSAVVGTRIVIASAAAGAQFMATSRQALLKEVAIRRMTAAAGTSTASIVAMTRASRLLAGSMALLGGPAGAISLIVGGLTLYASHQSRASRASEEARDAHEAQAKSVADLREEYEELGRTEARRELQALQQEREQLQEQRSRTHEALKMANETLADAEQAMADATGMSASETAAVAEARREVREMGDNLQYVDRMLRETNQEIVVLNQQLDESSSSVLTLNERFSQMAEMVRQAGQENAGFSESFDEVAERIALQIMELQAGSDAVERYRAVQELGNDATDQEIELVENLFDSLQRLRRQREQAAEERRQQEEEQRAQDRIDTEAEQIANQLRSEEEQIRASYERRREIVMQASIYTAEERNQVLRDLEEQHNEELSQLNQDFWSSWLERAEEALASSDEMVMNTVSSMTQGFGTAMADMALDSENLGDALHNLFSGVARTAITSLGEMGTQWLIYQAVQRNSAKATQASAATAKTLEAQATSVQAGLNAFASTAAIPVVGPAAAPGAMQAAVAATQPAAQTVAGLMSGSVAARRHGGSVMSGQDVLVGERGPEMVRFNQGGRVTPYQNLMSEASGGKTVNVPVSVNVRVDGNAENDSVTQGRDGDRHTIDVVVANIRGRREIHKAFTATTTANNKAE